MSRTKKHKPDLSHPEIIRVKALAASLQGRCPQLSKQDCLDRAAREVGYQSFRQCAARNDRTKPSLAIT